MLANPGNTQVARVAAGLQVKNSLTSKDPDVKAQYQQRWLAIDINARREIKNYVRAEQTPLTVRHRLHLSNGSRISGRFYRLWARRRTGPARPRSASPASPVPRFP